MISHYRHETNYVQERPDWVASFTKEVNPRLAKRPLKTNGRLANLELTSLLKEATAAGWQPPDFFDIFGFIFS